MKEFLVARMKAKRKNSGAKKKIAAKKRKASGKEAKSRVYKGKQSSRVERVTGSQVIWSKTEVKTPRKSHREDTVTRRSYVAMVPPPPPPTPTISHDMMVPPPPPPTPTIPPVHKELPSDAATIDDTLASKKRDKKQDQDEVNTDLTTGG
jgi:hypothetical protein